MDAKDIIAWWDKHAPALAPGTPTRDLAHMIDETVIALRKSVASESPPKPPLPTLTEIEKHLLDCKTSEFVHPLSRSFDKAAADVIAWLRSEIVPPLQTGSGRFLANGSSYDMVRDQLARIVRLEGDGA